MKNFMRILVIAFLFFPIWGMTQNAKFVQIRDLSLCLEDTVVISIQNNTSEIIPGDLTLELPCGMLFKGLIGMGEELSAQPGKANLKLESIAPNKEVKVVFKVLAPCDMISCVDGGELFRYAIVVGGKKINSPFFNIDSPSLNLISMLPESISGINGNDNYKIVKIKNTRPGKIKSFIYKDSTLNQYNVLTNIIQEYNYGKIIRSKTGVTEILFDAETFKKIGNYDDFFDFNEVIDLQLYYEEMYCLSVSFKQYTKLTFFCNGLLCKQIDTLSKGDLIGDITLKTIVVNQDPICYKGGVAQQVLKIVNLGNYTTATNIQVVLRDTVDAIGIVKNSVLSDQTINNISYEDETLDTCGFVSYKKVNLTFNKILPGDTIEIAWLSQYCSNVKTSSVKWDYTVEFDWNCIDDFSYTAQPLYGPFRLFSFFPTEFNYIKDKIFLGGIKDSVLHIVKSDRFENYTGKLRLTYTLPCNIEFQSSAYKNFLVNPTSIDINNGGVQNTLTLEYPLPFNGHGVKIAIPFKPDCQKMCTTTSDTCGSVVVSSCKDLCSNAFVEQFLEVKMEVIDTTFPCPNGYPITYFNEPLKTTCFNQACPDTLAAYLDQNFLFERINYGWADNNDDNVPELSTPIDKNKVNKHAVIIGDTLLWSHSGKIVVDDVNTALNYFTLQLDAKLIEFLGNNFDKKDSIYRDFWYNGGLDFSNHTLRLKKKQSNTWYDLEKGSLIQDSVAGLYQIRYDLNKLKSQQLLPDRYQFSEGDSIRFEARVVISENFLSKWKASIPRRNIFSKMEIELTFKTHFSQQLIEDIDDIYVCQCQQVQLEVCSFYGHYNTLDVFANDDALHCKDQDMVIGFISNYYGIKPEIFKYEVRPIFPAKGISVNTLGYLRIDRMQILAYSDDRLIYNNPNASFVPMGDSTVHWFPEDLIFGELTEIRMEVAMTQKNDIHFNDLSDFVTIKFIYDKEDLPSSFNEAPATLIYEVPFAFPDLELLDTIFNIYDKRNSYITEIYNVPDYANAAENSFMYISPNLSSDITIHKVFFAKTGVEIPLINGLYQLGEIRPRQKFEIGFEITSSSCKDEILDLFVGWNCRPVNNLNEPINGEIRKLSILLKYFPGVVDMTYSKEDVYNELCTTTEDIEVVVINGDFGSIHELIYSLELPRGMSFIPGSFKMTFPFDGSEFPIPDPTYKSENTYIYDLDKTIDVFRVEGLKGILNENRHLFNISFKAATNCQFISGTKIIHRAEAKQKCGLLSNRRAKASPYYFISGLDTIEKIEIFVEKEPEFIDCTNKSELEFKLEKLIVSGQKGRLYFQLPEGVFIQQNEIMINGTILPLDFDGLYHFVELAAGSIEYEVSVMLQTTVTECDELILPVFTTIERNAFCKSSSDSCTIEQVTGDRFLLITIQKPSFKIEKANIISFQNNTIAVRANVKNSGHLSSKPFRLQLIFDTNNNSKPDPGEFVFLDSMVVNANEAFDLLIEKNKGILKTFQLCKLILVIQPNGSCICNGDYARLNGEIQMPGLVDTLCYNETVLLKTPEPLSGESYFWTPLEGLSCMACPENTYSTLNDPVIKALESFTLFDEVTDQCIISHNFNLYVLPKAEIDITTDTVCIGQEVLLKSSVPQNNIWLSNGKELSQNDEVSLEVSSLTEIILVNGRGCGASDTVEIIPYTLPFFSAGNDTMLCFRKNIILNPLVGQNKTFNWIDGSGSLSDTEVLRPVITKNVSSEFVLKVCDDVCCAFDTVRYDFSNNLSFELPIDSFISCINDTLRLTLDTSLIYIWTDNVKPFCANEDCTQLIIPITVEELSIQVQAFDSVNCRAEDILHIKAVPFINMPEVQKEICDGDSIWIAGQFIKAQGIYCDTTKLTSGCRQVQCYQVNVFPKSNSETSIEPCDGEEVIFQGKLIEANGLYCANLESSNGCDSVECINVVFRERPEILLDSLSYSVSPGSNLLLEEKGQHFSYNWSANTNLSCSTCNATEIKVEENTEVTLIVSNAFHCKDTAVIRINVTPKVCFDDVHIPNAFTPNANNSNDVFRVVNNSEVIIDLMEIFNEWGQKVFESRNNEGWDGRIDGTEAPQASYVYIIKLRCGEEIKQVTGHVTLLR